MRKVHTRESILAELAPWIAEHQRLPRSLDWSAKPYPPASLHAIYHYFDTVENLQKACVEAGIATQEMLWGIQLIRRLTLGGRRRTTGKRSGAWQ
jgi:hypothetical protein